MLVKNVFIMGSRGYKRNYGGWETLVKNLIEYWTEESTIFYVSEIVNKKEDEKIIKQDGVLCQQVYAPKVGNATMVLFASRALLKAMKYVKENEVENAVFYILGLRIGPLFYILRKKFKKLGIKVVINPDGFEWQRAKYNWLVKLYFRFSAYTMFKSANMIICDSKIIKEYVLNKYRILEDKVVYIAYGANLIDNPKLNDVAQKFYIKHDIKEKEYFLVVGRFIPENNYEIMIKEFILSKTNKDLVIISNVIENKFYKKLLKSTNFDKDKRIKFVGTLYDQEILRQVRVNAYAYIHGHSAGGTNPSLLEAMATTNLSILFNVPFNTEVGRTATLYFDSAIKLSSIINKTELLSNKEIIDFGRECKNIIHMDYTWELVADLHRKTFSKLISVKSV